MEINKARLLLGLIIILGLLYRSVLWVNIPYTFEPDNLIYNVMQQETIANNYIIPTLNAYSGFPTHNPYNEGRALVYLVVAPYFALHMLGISADLLGISAFVQLLFAILGIVIAYMFAKLITDNEIAGLFSAFLYATIPAAIYRGSIVEWRGESFAPILLALAVLILLLAFRAQNWRRRALLLMPASILVFLFAPFYPNLIWNGSIYAFVTFFFALALLAAYRLFHLPVRFLVFISVVFIIVSWQTFIYFRLPGSDFFISYNYPLSLTTSETQLTSITFLLASFLAVPFLATIGLFGFLARQREDAHNLAFLAVLAILLVALPEALVQVRWTIFLALPLVILSGISLRYLAERAENTGQDLRNVKKMAVLTVFIFLLIPIYQFGLLQPNPEVSQSYHAALIWVSNNTPANSTFLTQWSDGSAIEAWAHRQSYTDSVMGEHNTSIYNFSRFMFAAAGNFSYLKRVNPDYLLIRSYSDWINIKRSMAIEGGLPANISINRTNFKLLVNESPANIISDGINLRKVYADNGISVYLLH